MEEVKMRDDFDVFGRPERIALVKGAIIMNGRFRNFSGKKQGPKDIPGRRYFNVQLENPEAIGTLISEHYNIRTYNDDFGNISRGYLNVKIKTEGSFACLGIQIESNGVKTMIPVEQWELLDGIEKDEDGDHYGSEALIAAGDLVLRLYQYEKGKYSAELKTGTFHLRPLASYDEVWAEEEWPHE